MDEFGHRLLLAFGVPVVFILVGAMGRKAVRKSSWERADFFLGPELCLAAFSADVLFMGALFNQPRHADGQPEGTAFWLLIAIVCTYLFLLTLHQDWERRTDRTRAQFIWLVVMSNLLGTGLFAAFVFLVEGAAQ